MSKKQITIRMPKEDLAQWLAALRAPENKRRQGTNYLFNPRGGGYCCLGVAQCIKTGGRVEATRDGIVTNWHGYPSLEWLGTVGWKFFDKAGNICRDPWLPSLDRKASHANDLLKKTFAEIADAIEDCAEGY